MKLNLDDIAIAEKNLRIVFDGALSGAQLVPTNEGVILRGKANSADIKVRAEQTLRREGITIRSNEIEIVEG